MLQILQANLHKGRLNQLSLLNDESISTYDIICVSEPYYFNSNGQTLTHSHNHWHAILPANETYTGHTPIMIRSMIWINKNITNFHILKTRSPDITAISLQTTDNRHLLVFSTYEQPDNGPGAHEHLRTSMDKIRRLYEIEQRKYGDQLDVIVAGDLNRHDPVWGGDHIAASRRMGEASPIIELMTDLQLRSLLPRGTITYSSGRWTSTIDLMLASDFLATRKISCQLHHTENGSDHRPIETCFELDTIPRIQKAPKKWCLKKACWDKIRDSLRRQQWSRPCINTPEELEMNLQLLVERTEEAIDKHTPKQKHRLTLNAGGQENSPK